MAITTIRTLITLCTVISGALSSGLVVHERRDELPHGWVKTSRVNTDAIIPARIALSQSNLDNMEQYMMEVSHPDSAMYGRHWTPKQVAETFAPSADSVNAVREWLSSAGVGHDRVNVSTSLSWVNFEAKVEELETLLGTQYHKYEHDTGAFFIGCDKYHVPETVSKHVDFITPTLHFDVKFEPRTASNERDDGEQLSSGLQRRSRMHYQPTHPKKTWPNATSLFQELKNCTNAITPDCLRALYRIPPAIARNASHALGIVEYSPNTWNQSDLDTFFSALSPHQVQKAPILNSIDGGFRNQSVEEEANLDLAYAMALANPIPVQVYQVGDKVQIEGGPGAPGSGKFDVFLDAIDASYCTFEGGDSELDPVYPDPAPGGYKGKLNCGTVAAAKVISTSYSQDEVSFTPAYERRQCSEYGKLGLLGVSVLYASGDLGVAGNNGQCLNSNGSLTGSEAKHGRFNPTFPSVCPWITSIGATQMKPNATVWDKEPEEAANVAIPIGNKNYYFSSGGGFSDVFTMPSYQKAAIAHYYAVQPPPYGSDRYNNSRMVRGYPDLSANGFNYVVVDDGIFTLAYGTSAATPTVAAILAIINQYRAEEGKGPVGFVNPVLYANPWALNDITMGHSHHCGTKGFSTAEGWDPVTGLGTPNVPKMLELFLRLP